MRDDKVYTNKLFWMIEIKYEGDGINKLNKIEAKIMMFTIIPQDFNIENVLDH